MHHVLWGAYNLILILESQSMSSGHSLEIKILNVMTLHKGVRLNHYITYKYISIRYKKGGVRVCQYQFYTPFTPQHARSLGVHVAWILMSPRYFCINLQFHYTLCFMLWRFVTHKVQGAAFPQILPKQSFVVYSDAQFTAPWGITGMVGMFLIWCPCQR